MASRNFVLVRRGPMALGILAVALTAVAFAWDSASKSDRPKPIARPALLFPRAEPARNPVTLQLQADERKVVGWLSGTQDFTDETVTVKHEGKTTKLTIGKDNSFTWEYKIAKPSTAEFIVPHGKKSLRGTVALVPPSATPGPSVFFVVDRTAYRPGQPLHFAGFLRKQNSAGEFTPITNEEVDIELISARKGTKAARMKLTSDEKGRVVGNYVFSDADALDHYTLSIKGYKGSARVLLGEYRKSKVRLKITGSNTTEKMKVVFEGLDFLDKPVPMTKASFVAQVVRRGKEKALTLKAEDFVHHEPKNFAFGDLDSLAEEDLLLWEADGITAQTFGGLGNVPLANFQGEMKPEGTRPAEYSFDLKKEWLRGDCAVIVNGVITDTNGREQRASTTITIEQKGTAEGKKTLELSLAKRRFFTTETIEVKAEGDAFSTRDTSKKATLVVMKLSFQTPSTTIGGMDMWSNPYMGRMPAYRSSRLRYPSYAIHPAAASAETIRRTLITAVPFSEDTARLKLTEPGAYKLIAVVPKEDGSSTQQETSIVVKRLDEANALIMRLDREEYSSTGKLTGVIHSRFADARALLTIRDSTGIRLTKPITFDKTGIYTLKEALPTGLRYGCTVDVSYPEDGDHTHVTQTFVRVVPNDRILTVQVKSPDNVQPGSTVNLDLQVNRNEPVDLVVSVYDQSLLGIAADRSVDIRNFYLADERISNQFGLALLQRRIGDVQIGPLFDKAQAILKETGKKGGKAKLSPNEESALKVLLSRRDGRDLYSMDIATLLRLAGVDVYLAPYRYGNNWYCQIPPGEKISILNLVKVDHHGWHLVPWFVGNTLVLHETHTSYRQAGYAWHPVFGWNFDSPFGYSPYANLRSSSMINSFSQLQFEQFGRGMGRGDAARSWNDAGMASANSMYSFVPEGQAFISHLPAGGAPVQLIDADSDQSHISVRRDFSDSAFWNATVRTDSQGKANVSFKLPDSLTNWQVVATAVSSRMHVGSTKASFRTFKPIMVWPMLPRTFTEGDRVEVFASVHNRTDKAQTIKVRLKVQNGEILTPEERSIQVEPKTNAPVYWTFIAGQPGFTQLLMTADCEAGSDASLKRLPVIRAAAEQAVTASGEVKKSATIEIPNGIDMKAARLEITFAPSLAADLADTLNYLVDYPYGCVEQTMSRFLPAIKVAQILKQFKVEHKELEKKLPGCVAGGIKRLLELQQPDGGWGWNGNGSTHEMMTPYALFGLLQAEKAGYQIPNETAINRGLDRLANFIHSMGDAQTADRIYCMYVYSHRRPITEQWWTWLRNREEAKALSDYALALALEMAIAQNQKTIAANLAKRLRERAKKSGANVWWETAGFSRWGDDKFEVTAAAMKALVALDKDDPLIDGILGFFTSTKRGDRWNSTKDTAMILYALTDYLAKSEYSASAMKNLKVSVNDGEAQTVTFDDQLTRKVIIPGDKLKAGTNTLKFRTAMTGVLYRAVFRYWKTGRAIEPMDQGIRVNRQLYLVNDKGSIVRELKSGDSVPRGSYVLSIVNATQRLPVNMRYVLVESPKASGGEIVPADDVRFAAQHQASTRHVLREDREAMTCFHHEETPQSLSDRCVFLAELAGEFIIPPARVELMYQTETCGHSGSFVLKVTEEEKKERK